MAQYVTREGQITAADTSTALTSQGSNSSPGGIQVPAGVSQIVQVIAAFQMNPATTTAEECCFIRLGGNGITAGEQDIVLGATESVLTTSGAAASFMNPLIIPAAIPVLVNGTVTINAEMGGTASPTGNVCVTLVFA